MFHSKLLVYQRVTFLVMDCLPKKVTPWTTGNAPARLGQGHICRQRLQHGHGIQVWQEPHLVENVRFLADWDRGYTLW